MDPYRTRIVRHRDKPTRARLVACGPDFILGLQAEMVNIVDMLHLRPQSQSILARYSSFSAETYESAVELDRKLEEIGHSTPVAALRAANLFRDHIVEFGVNRGDDPTNDLWRAIEWFLPTPETNSPDRAGEKSDQEPAQ